MDRDIEIVQDVWVETEESTPNHWVGSCRGVVIVVLHEGAHADPRHIQAAARRILRLSRSPVRPIRLLIVWPPSTSKPPSSEVRRAIAEVASACVRHIDRAAGVVLGASFLQALHRSTITGILTVTRSTANARMFASLVEGLRHLVEGDDRLVEALRRFCEARLSEGSAPGEVGAR
ncbi:MAG: hypothetical protein U0414_00870 [Polyangiaceae bacterium]